MPRLVEFQLNSAKLAESQVAKLVARGLSAVSKAKKYETAIDPAALRAAAVKCYDCYQKDVNLLRVSRKADAQSALELGKAFIAMRELCTERGMWSKWLRSFDADKNRINYCIRVAEQKVGKNKPPAVAPEKKRTDALLMEPIVCNIRLLLKLSQHGNRAAAQNLIANMVLDLERFVDDNFPKEDEPVAADSTFGPGNFSVEPPLTHHLVSAPISGPLFDSPAN